jgi:hypothetical protein
MRLRNRVQFIEEKLTNVHSADNALKLTMASLRLRKQVLKPNVRE